MNPDKLFDYLDGKLSPADRDELENRLIADPQLQRQFAIARDIHRSGRVSREIHVPAEDPAVAERGGRLGRRIATGVIVLVLLNVLGGLAAISYLNKRPPRAQASPQSDAADPNGVRRQMEDSLRAAGASALPIPSLTDDEIKLAAPKAEWANFSAAIARAAIDCGGSAVPEEPQETSVSITANLPRERYAEFRRRLLGPGAPEAKPSASAPGETRGGFETVQIRITESGQ
jgi:anti-sigma factor RsiW